MQAVKRFMLGAGVMLALAAGMFYSPARISVSPIATPTMVSPIATPTPVGTEAPTAVRIVTFGAR